MIDICALLLDKGADAMMENDLGELPPRWVRELADKARREATPAEALRECAASTLRTQPAALSSEIRPHRLPARASC